MQKVKIHILEVIVPHLPLNMGLNRHQPLAYIWKAGSQAALENQSSMWCHAEVIIFLRLFLSLGDPSRVWVLRQFSEIQTMYAVSGEPISFVFWEEIKHLICNLFQCVFMAATNSRCVWTSRDSGYSHLQ